MRPVLVALVVAVASVVRSRMALHLEVLALRHQLAVYQRGAKRPRLRPADRILWAWLSRAWSRWRDALIIVQPRTVISWQRRRFRDHWTRLSLQGKPGRPRVAKEVRDLIRKMSRANATWGSPRIVGELRKLGIEVAKSTVRFEVLFVFVVLAHARRRVVHFNITKHPTAQWAAQQVVEAFPWDTAPRFLLRDRDGVYGADFRGRVASLNIGEVVIAARSPWQSPYVERMIGSIRRECLDQVVVLGEQHLRRLLAEYLSHYHDWRCHRGLDMDCPEPRRVHLPEVGDV